MVLLLSTAFWWHFGPMPRNDSQIKLRLPAGTKQLVEAAALKSKRSINSEIVSRIESTFQKEMKESINMDANIKKIETAIAYQNTFDAMEHAEKVFNNLFDFIKNNIRSLAER